MKIILCNPEANSKYSHSRKGMYPPLGLLSLATRLDKDYSGKIEIELLDGDIQDISGESLIGADIVGFHTNSFNYRNCLQLAEQAKNSGSIIIFGGPHATVLWKNIMRNRDFVDFIIIDEGEQPLSSLIGKLLGENRLECDGIPNLVYRNTDKEKKGFQLSPNRYKNSGEDMRIPSRGYLDIEKYIQNYRKMYAQGVSPFKRPASVYSSKGCVWRDKTGGCVFCARLEQGVTFRNIADLWHEVRQLNRLYATDFIWDISDDNLSSPAWFKAFVNKKPDDLAAIGYLIYSRVNRITDEIIPYLKKLNVYEVYLGFESGDQRILQNMGKGTTLALAIKAAKRLKAAGIFYFPSFVIGLPGESEQSLRNTLAFARQLSEIGSIQRMSATILWPAPGSKAFAMLLDDSQYGRWLAEQDDISITDLEKLWINRYTKIDYPAAERYRKLIGNALADSAEIKSFGVKSADEQSKIGY